MLHYKTNSSSEFMKSHLAMRNRASTYPIRVASHSESLVDRQPQLALENLELIIKIFKKQNCNSNIFSLRNIGVLIIHTINDIWAYDSNLKCIIE